MNISAIRAREILDSRGNPTLEVRVIADEYTGIASVPSGLSRGIHEAHELRDGGKRYHGLGVLKAVKNVVMLSKRLEGMNVADQEGIDQKMVGLDGTQNKGKLGANTLLGVSLAVARCAAQSSGIEPYEYIGELWGDDSFHMPVPFFNIINGGKHAGNLLGIQEFMIAVLDAKSFAEALQMGSEIYHTLGEILKKHNENTATLVGDEGGYAPQLRKTSHVLEYMTDAISEAGYEKKVKIALDAAASEFFLCGGYTLEGKKFSREKLIDFYGSLVRKYRVISIEDPLQQDDFNGFSLITRKLRDKAQIVGDDLFATNAERLRQGIEEKAANCLLLKPNQIGTLTESLEVAKICFDNGYNIMVSHRSGETCDSFISDLAVGISCGQIKAGAPCRGERLAKYNRLLEIEVQSMAPFTKRL